MSRMKTFLKYLVLFVALYLFVSFVSFAYVKTTYNKLEKEVIAKGPSIVIEDAQATYINGYVKGKIINDTKEVITNQYVKIDLRTKHDNLIMSKYVKIEDLNSLEMQNFEVKFNCEAITKINVSITNEIADVEPSELISDTSMGPARIMATIVLLFFL